METDAVETQVILVLALASTGVVAWLTALAALLLLGIWLVVRQRRFETDPALPGAVCESSSAQRFRPSRRRPSPISGALRSEVYR